VYAKAKKRRFSRFLAKIAGLDAPTEKCPPRTPRYPTSSGGKTLGVGESEGEGEFPLPLRSSLFSSSLGLSDDLRTDLLVFSVSSQFGLSLAVFGYLAAQFLSKLWTLGRPNFATKKRSKMVQFWAHKIGRFSMSACELIFSGIARPGFFGKSFWEIVQKGEIPGFLAFAYTYFLGGFREPPKIPHFRGFSLPIVHKVRL